MTCGAKMAAIIHEMARIKNRLFPHGFEIRGRIDNSQDDISDQEWLGRNISTYLIHLFPLILLGHLRRQGAANVR
jgi:hypothetical protein